MAKTNVAKLYEISRYSHETVSELERMAQSGYSRTDVQQYIDYLAAKKRSAATINLVFNAIKIFSKWAGKRDTVEDIRIVKSPNRKKEAPQALTKKERLTLLRDIDRSGNKRNFAIVMVLLNTGIRNMNQLVSFVGTLMM